ncbi:unnamed protein product [Callosobruchus maculatus]|nr:unnamed protein product [Callosobruchus maculatus]
MSGMIHKMIASDEDTIRRDSSNSDTGNINQRFKKCVRKGDIVCFTNEENIHMANKPNKHAPTKAALDQPKSVERMSSGESLYKTFTFAQSANEEDTEKCIAFWKSVMEKNLQPVKCSIIEDKEYQPKDDVEDEPSKCEKQSDSKTKIEETKQEVNIEEQIDEKLKLVHKEYRNMWDKAIKQIQKQKLDKIKLLRKSRCKMCDVLNTRFDEDVCGDEATIDKEIKDLNKWKSTARKKAYATGSSRGSRSQQEKPKQMSTKLKKAKEIRPTGANAAEDTEEQEILDDKPKKMKPPPDTNTYEFVDAIANKLQSGTYSEWRSNALKETCTCGYRICCCNTNPAVKGILSSSCLPFQPIPVVNIDKTTKKTDTRASLIDKKEPEKLPARSSLSRKSDELSNHKNAVKKALSLLIQCECSTESCDCEEEYQPLSRSKLPAEHWEIPPPPELHLPAQKR